MDGTNPAVEELLAHTRWVEDLARSLVRDPAAASDVVQSAWVIALRDPDRPRHEIRGWLGTVVRNLARERHRREAQRSTVERSGARSEALPSAHELVARADAERALVRTVTELDEPHRTTLLLHYFEGLGTREIARREGVEIAVIAHRLTRAHARLRERLGARAGGAGWLAALAPILRVDVGVPGLSRAKSSALQETRTTMTTSAKIVVPALCVAGLCAYLFLRTQDVAVNEPNVARADVASTRSSATTPVSPATDARRTPADPPVESRSRETAPADATATPVAQAVPTGGRIHGSVLRPDASPAAGRRIRLVDMKPIDGKGFREIFTECDANGRFDKRDLGAGTWCVSTWPNAAELELVGIPVEGSLGGLAFLIERTIELEELGTVELALGIPPKDPIHVRGRVLRGDEPVKTIAVQWLPAGDGIHDLKQTSRILEDGRYDVTLEHPGTYYVHAILDGTRPDWTIVVADGREQTLDFVLPPNVIEGRVVDENGSAVPKATVELSVRGGRRAPLLLSSMSLACATDAEGRFRFDCLHDGMYVVHAFGGEFGGVVTASGAAVASKPVRAALPGASAEVVLTLVQGVRAPVRVVDATGKERTASVFVFDADGECSNPASGHVYGKSGPRTTIALAPGRYGAVAAHGLEWSAPIEFEIRAGEPAPNLELHLAPAAEVEVDGTAFPGSLVEVRDDAGRRYGSLIDRARSNRAVERTWNSDVPTLRLPPGNYTVEARGIDEAWASVRIGLGSGENPRVVLRR